MPHTQPVSMNRPASSSMAPSAAAYLSVDDSSALLTDWALDQMPQPSFEHDAAAAAAAATSLVTHLTAPYAASFEPQRMEFQSLGQPLPHSGLPMDQLVGLETQVAAVPWAWDYEFEGGQALPGNACDTTLGASPTDSQIEVRSLTSSNSDTGWATVDHRPFDSFHDPQAAAIFNNPFQTLHNRTCSSSSNSDGPDLARNSLGSFDEVWPPLTSPSSDPRELTHVGFSQPDPSAAATVDAESIKPPASPLTSSSQGTGSPPLRRQAWRSPTAKATKPAIKRQAQPPRKDAAEKRVGRRRGPLPAEKRKQAGEIRKLRACLRCKFLKKVCDKGEPCAGCQPAHARLWQVPCTRIDIKDVAYFMKDWKADFERHVTLAFSVDNIKGFSQDERSVYVTHGYGIALPIMAREVYVRDDRCFDVDWVEANSSSPIEFEVRTARLSAGEGGIPADLLSEYLDHHIDGGFEIWVDEYFEGTPFLTEMLKTVYRYYLREKLPVIRKALKLVLAYNLTMHVTLIEGLTEEENVAGKITDESSRFRGKTVAPVMINFQIKCALAKMWRELQKDILEELSALYQSVWNGNKWKNWPTTFLLAAVLLAVWEEMQFDCHYRVPVSSPLPPLPRSSNAGRQDAAAVRKFCTDMETVPVGVIVGLFSAMSQKVPAFTEWDTLKHGHLFSCNGAVCDAMSEVRQHVTAYGEDGFHSFQTCRS